MVVTPQERFADWLVQLRVAAGNPSYGDLVTHNATAAPGRLRGQLNRAGLSALLNAAFVRPPRWEVIEAFVDACRAAAVERYGDVTPEAVPQLRRSLWRERHADLVRAVGPRRPRAGAAPREPAAEEADPDGSGPLPESVHDRYGATRSAFESYHSVVLDREEDLARLLAAVRGPGAYHVVEAPAFAGKTAFTVELYRRLCARGCPTAVFYVVDRYAHRSQDFLEAAIGQLLTALRSREPLAPPEERPAQFARLWTGFAALGTAGRPAVLLVDGLDEQLTADGVSPLLPVRVSGHAHVVVATRSLPDFRAAVPRHHALAATPVHVVPLKASPHAEARHDDAQRHLEHWLSSAEPTPERVATLLRVAAAPLTRHDLADLLDLGVGRVARLLHGIERCLLPLTLECGGTGYQWAHTTYGEFVDDWVGKARSAQEIHQVIAWADRYADDGWPGTTPPFLLHGLHHFVRAHRDLVGGTRLVDLVSTARRRRLLAAYGHEATFLETIAFAREALRVAQGPATDRGLELAFRLDLHHLTATASTAGLPSGLLGLLVRSGQARQAEGIALCVEETYRAEALAEVAEAHLDTGAAERARELADRAWAFTAARGEAYWQLVALGTCARAAGRTGAGIPPFAPGDWLEDADQRVFCACAQYLLEVGEPEAARSVLAELLAHEHEYGPLYPWVLADAAAVLSRLGDLDAAVDLVRRAGSQERTAFLLGSHGTVPVSRVVGDLVRAARVEDACALASAATSEADYLRAGGQAALSEALAAEGHRARAAALLERELSRAAAMSHETMRFVSLAYLRAAQAGCGDGDVPAMRRLVEGADAIEYGDGHVSAGLTKLGEGLLAAGDRDGAVLAARHALDFSGRYSHPFADELLHQVTVASIEVGDRSGARRVAEANPNRAWRSQSVRAVELAEAAAGHLAAADRCATWDAEHRAELALAWARAGRTAAARDLAHGVIAEWNARHRPAGQPDGILWAAVLRAVEALHRSDGVAPCATTLARLRPAARRAEALAKLSACCRTTPGSAADTLLDEAVALADRLRDDSLRPAALCATVGAAGPLRERPPAVTRAIAAFRRRTAHLTDSTGAGLRASMAVALSRTGLDEDARAFAGEAYDVARAVGAERDVEDAYRVGEALTRVGMNDHALRLTEDLDLPYSLPDIVRSHALAGDTATAGRVAEKAAAVWAEVARGDAFATEMFIEPLLRAGRADLAETMLQEALAESLEFGVVVDAYFAGMVAQGLADTALSQARGLELRHWKAAALVAWGTAAAWPLDVRRRHVRLLQEHVVERLWRVDGTDGDTP
ncbi:hypothetical protein C9F11_38840 [Streptomyces sp. YIM 121038]|uniref:hypothetical protein n=1 Tax=Streptomyces sp. YIM 121038 TaxID=2136401 RepID=UPI0011100A58|nr:hypothetical protein [Streptomyces sp. YIM 121038]QCX81351.1 hypothetical protein C9F11_38840 [Streptomyces sp. YIM 121038]